MIIILCEKIFEKEKIVICDKVYYDVPAVIISDKWQYDKPSGLIWWHIKDKYLKVMYPGYYDGVVIYCYLSGTEMAWVELHDIEGDAVCEGAAIFDEDDLDYMRQVVVHLKLPATPEGQPQFIQDL